MRESINVRSIHANELNIFGNADRASDFWDRFRSNRKREWEEGRSSPEMCFVAEANGDIVGRLVFSGSEDVTLGFFEIPWERDDHILIGKELLRRSCIMLLERGYRSISVQIGNEVPNSEKRRQVMKSASIGLRREKVIFTAPDDAPPVTTLRFEGLDVVGKDQFVEAIVQVNEGCLDSDIKERHAAASSADEKKAVAREQFDSFGVGYRGTEQLWELAFHKDQCVGVSMPGLFPKEKYDDSETGTICYIGVVADQRGKRFGREILLRLTKQLYDIGVDRPWADTESMNLPMISTFTAAGWKENGRNFQYWANLREVCA